MIFELWQKWLGGIFAKGAENPSCLFSEVLPFLHCTDTQSQPVFSEIYFNLRPSQPEWTFSIYWHDTFSISSATPSASLHFLLPPPNHISLAVFKRTREESYDRAGNGLEVCFFKHKKLPGAHSGCRERIERFGLPTSHSVRWLRLLVVLIPKKRPHLVNPLSFLLCQNTSADVAACVPDNLNWCNRTARSWRKTMIASSSIKIISIVSIFTVVVFSCRFLKL